MKKILVTLLAAVLVFTLASCSMNDIMDLVSRLEDAEASANGEASTGDASTGDASTGESGDRVEIIDDHTEKLLHYDGYGNLVFYHVTTYDDNRKIIHLSAFDGAGGTIGSYDYKYNENGDLLEGAWFFWNDGILMKNECKYNEKGQLVEDYAHGNDTRNVLGNKRIFYYLENGKVDYIEYYMEWRENGTHGEPVFDRNEYNDDWQLVKQTRYTAQDVLDSYVTYEYDENGKRVHEVFYDGDGSVDFSYEYEYDKDGRRTETRRYNGNGDLVAVEN